jgi:hypothetical protein
MSRIQRWWLVGGALAVVAVVAVTAVVLVSRNHGAGPTSRSERPAPTLPAQLLLTSSMRQQPVPGWKISAEDLGLPGGTVMKPFGNVGDRGYFVGVTGEGWWLVGIDVAAGRRLFEPVRLGPSNDALAFNCFVNGSATALCLRQDRDPAQPARAWVVNTESGTLTFDGPTDLRIPPTDGHPELVQVGDYVVAAVEGEGVHGVGPHAELTWFVPGSGHLTQSAEWARDVGPQRLAVQDGASTASVVFSVEDGTVVKPDVQQGERLGRAMVFPGGLGYEYQSGSDGTERVAFFDDAGRSSRRPDLNGTLGIGSLDVPLVRTETRDVFFNLEGQQLLDIPAAERMPYARLIGKRLFVTTDASVKSWQQYDLRTDTVGKTCEIEDLAFSYIASDGTVAVVVGRRTPAQAFDLATCEPLWSIPGSTQGEAKDVWKVNTTLVQRTNDELFSLVAPR